MNKRQYTSMVVLALFVSSFSCASQNVVSPKEKPEGLISNRQIAILEHQLVRTNTEVYLTVLYQAKTMVEQRKVKIVVDCFDKDGNAYQGSQALVPEIETLYEGEVRRVRILWPSGAHSYKLRLVKI